MGYQLVGIGVIANQLYNYIVENWQTTSKVLVGIESLKIQLTWTKIVLIIVVIAYIIDLVYQEKKKKGSKEKTS